MSQIRRHPLALTVTVVMTASALAGCGGGQSAAPSAPTFSSNASTSSAQTSTTLPVSNEAEGSVFSAGGRPQIIVKPRSGGSVASRHQGLKSVRTIRGLGLEVVSVDPGQDMQSMLARLGQDPAVAYAEPNYTVRMIAGSNNRIQAEPPNDPKFADQYAPQITKTVEAWEKTRGANVVVAIVDTGIDVTHPEFAGKIVPGFAAEDASPTLTPPEKDDNGHGTHVAGITAALAGNAEGIVGIAPEAKLMPVKVLSAGGSGSYAGVAEGMVWAINNGATVLNMSLGGPSSSKAIEDAVKLATSKNVLIVAAMGNSGNGKKSYPAAIAGVMAVGATDSKDEKASFSQFGNWISVAAPGVKILSTFPTYTVDLSKYGFPLNYAVLDGTSMATPAVTGLVALVRSAFPDMTAGDVRKKIEAGADDLGAKGFDTKFGHGRINAANAVK